MSAQLKLEAIDSALTESALVYDWSLSLSIGCASGFFVATCGQAYADNVLRRAFGVNVDTGASEAGLLAGSSMVVGFLLAQVRSSALSTV